MPYSQNRRRVPSSTYRLQLRREFPVQSVIGLVPYLSELGIGAVYLSPILKARPGSSHGYDVVDPDFLNPDLGTPDEFRQLGEELHRAGMGLIVDIVPNHMCIADSGNWPHEAGREYWNQSRKVCVDEPVSRTALWPRDLDR